MLAGAQEAPWVPAETMDQPSDCTALLLVKMSSLQDAQKRMEQILVVIQSDLDSLVTEQRSPVATCPSPGKYCVGIHPGSQASYPEEPMEPHSPMPGTSVEAQYSGQRRPSILEHYVESKRSLSDGLTSSVSPRMQRGMYSLEASFNLESTTLPRDWPSSVKIRKSLADDMVDKSLRRTEACRTGSTSRAVLMARRLQHFTAYDPTFSLSMTAKTGVAFLSRFMLDPTASLHVFYSLVKVIVLLYDLTIIPYTLAWDVDINGWLYVTSLISCIFWTVDIVMSFLTGIQQGERVEMNPRIVALHFARTSLAPDLAMVICNWLSLLLEVLSDGQTSASGLRIIRFAQVGKLLRITSLLRLMKVTRVLEELLENSLSDNLRLLSKCICVVVGTLWVNHVIGCAWFALGRLAPSDTGTRWIDLSTEADGVLLDFMDAGGLYQYLTAMHWSVAQLTLGAIDVNPVNAGERVFNISCLIGGLVFGSTLISSLSATMVEFQMTRKSRNDEIRKLRRFLRENQVRQSVAVCVLQQARERLFVQEKIREKDVHALQKISKSLYIELRCQMFEPHVYSHPLFLMWSSFDRGVVRHLCNAIEYNTMLQGDDLFCAGVSTDRSYLLTEGNVEYLKEPATCPVEIAGTWDVTAGCWLSEASLWSHWMHVGTAKAVNTCQVLAISAEGVQAVLQRSQDLKEATAEYCKQFHRRIASARPPRSAWPDDLRVPHTEFDELVMCMSTDVQVAIGLSAVDYTLACEHDQEGWWSLMGGWRNAREVDHNVERLREEVRTGKSCVLLNAAGRLERVVFVAVLQAHTEDGKVLVELGKCENMTRNVKGSWQLPACKQDPRESAVQTLERLLSMLGLERQYKNVFQGERAVECRPSKDFGVQTKYLRTVYTVALCEDDIRLPTITANPHAEVACQDSQATMSQPLSVYSAALGDAKSEREATLEYDNIPTHQVFSGNKTIYYAWVPAKTFRSLSGPRWDRELRTWLAALCRAEDAQALGI
mmetsp:Transcript_109741/g.321248  ORF Transcript_109741/g.321248 Transcript_109741/m.321248 type:complete len:998 (+) Transcript_109741:54-3047(+)